MFSGFFKFMKETENFQITGHTKQLNSLESNIDDKNLPIKSDNITELCNRNVSQNNNNNISSISDSTLTLDNNHNNDNNVEKVFSNNILLDDDNSVLSKTLTDEFFNNSDIDDILIRCSQAVEETVKPQTQLPRTKSMPLSSISSNSDCYSDEFNDFDSFDEYIKNFDSKSFFSIKSVTNNTKADATPISNLQSSSTTATQNVAKLFISSGDNKTVSAKSKFIQYCSSRIISQKP